MFVEANDYHDERLFSIVSFVIYVIHLLTYESDCVNVEFLGQAVGPVAKVAMLVVVENCKQVLELDRNCLDKDYTFVEDSSCREMVSCYHLHEVAIVV